MHPFDLSTLTTPERIDRHVLQFCRGLSKQSPVFVDVTPETWCRQSCCEMNVGKLIEEIGGEKIVGYKIWYIKDKYIEAERHVIHINGGTFRDPTFNADGELRILFVSDDDQASGYEGRRLKVRRGLSLTGERFASLANTSDHRIKRMSNEESWNTMLTYEAWKKGVRMPNLILTPSVNNPA